MPKRVLIVSPHFPPINAPDHQRVRMSLPYLRDFGWDPTILTVDVKFVPGVMDHLLAKTVPDDIEIVATKALPAKLTKLAGLGSLAFRALPNLRFAGDRMLTRDKFDLVYFSTTCFPVMSLGPHWLRKFRVPYVLDFQDPWLSDYYDRPGAPPPPGGRLKYRFMRALNQNMEPPAVAEAEQFVSVSPKYPKMLRERYPALRRDQFTVLPFGAPEPDFDKLPSLGVKQSVFKKGDGMRHWTYVGRGGDDMAPALRILFSTIKRMRDENPEPWKSVRLHFVGTSYAQDARARETIRPIAEAEGVGDLVEERTARIPYFEALQLLVESDAVLLIGSDDPDYTASKLYPCILAKRPLAGVFHEESSVVHIMRDCRAGECATFASGQPSESSVDEMRGILARLLERDPNAPVETDWDEFEQYTAREMTRRQCDVFNKCLS